MNRYLTHQGSVLAPYIQDAHTLLDFGCDDMDLDRHLIRENLRLQITGIDVVDSHPKLDNRMKFTVYNGKTIPFPKKSFDITMAYHVFHHCEDPIASLSEVKRVTKKRIIIIESVLRSNLEIPGFMLADFLANVRREAHIPMPFHVHTAIWWNDVFKKLQLRVVEQQSVGVFPTWLPIGKTTLYILSV